MSRRQPPPEPPRLALRREEAARSLGISVETFDAHVRPELPVVVVGDRRPVRLYPVDGIQVWLRTNGRQPP